jgi:drug/metabolite transporter (DMT)-like permease
MRNAEGLGLVMGDQPKMTAADWGLLLTLSVLGGGSFFFAKVIVREVPPLTVVLTRFSIAAAALWLYLRARRLAVPRSLSIWAAFTGMGLLNNLFPAALVTWHQGLRFGPLRGYAGPVASGDGLHQSRSVLLQGR